MIWGKVDLLKGITTTDELNNKIISDYETILTTDARYTPWTDEEVELEGREVTKNEQRFLLPKPYEDIKDADAARMDGNIYSIAKKAANGPRWSLIRVKVYKQ